MIRAACRDFSPAIKRTALLFFFFAGAIHPIHAQVNTQEPAIDLTREPVQDQTPATQPSTLDRTLGTLHGYVRNAATGDGIPRALVSVEGDANTGALTDGQGRFEIPNIPVGPQAVEVRKPGFRDFSNWGGEAAQGDRVGPVHNVLIAAAMPDIIFTLSPMGSIRGQVELSTGDAAANIAIDLARRVIQGGRIIWQPAGTTKTRSDGTYRFGLLAEGDYAIFTEPALDTDLYAASAGGGAHSGFPVVYYPDARDPSGIGRIHVNIGQETQANFSLTLEPFQTVSATVVFPPGSGASRAGMNFNAAVLDTANRPLPYRAEYDEESHAVRAELPDGSYTLLVTGDQPPQGREGRAQPPATVFVGAVEVTVAGRPIANLRVPMSASRPSPVQLMVHRNAAAATRLGPVTVMVSPAAGWIDDNMVSEFATGDVSGPLEPVYTRPGAYWVRTQNQPGLCVESVTAGGSDLAREPIVIGLSGSTAPIELTLRDDCASLQLSLPDAQSSIAAGEEPFYTVYVVPDFPSSAEIEPATLRASTGGSMTVNGLTPGNYHVYTFVGAAQLPYRNRAALAALRVPGQAISLGPGTTGSLVVEAPAQ